MGILRDAAVKIAKDTFVLFGTSAIIAAKDQHDRKKEEESEKKEEKINKRFKLTSFFSKYKNHLLAICHENDEDTKTYVFSTADNKIEFFTSCPDNFNGILFYDYDENVIGSVVLDNPDKSGFLFHKKYSRNLILYIGKRQVGTVEIVIVGKSKRIKVHSDLWDVWLNARDSSFESEKEFKIKPMDLFSKTAYQIGFNDESKSLLLALTFVAVNEAKCIIKDVR
ncbi:hypothetical protein [Butyrivibrio fibrisolvens]|uniref:hypothetical protein n=1 Tax=Butyrivibrio fibrisolvens TaxID=831 RepID=UPI0020BF7296|nr:hypothetical protein [Butyrivibrio fibrisolvens]